MKKFITIILLLFCMSISAQQKTEKEYFIYDQKHKLIKVDGKIKFKESQLEKTLNSLGGIVYYLVGKNEKGQWIECKIVKSLIKNQNDLII